MRRKITLPAANGLEPNETFPMPERIRDQQTWLVTASLVTLAVAALAMMLRYTQSVLVPFVIAVFIVSLVTPTVDYFHNRWKFTHTTSVILGLLLVFVISSVLAAMLFSCIRTIANNSRVYADKVERVSQLASWRVQSWKDQWVADDDAVDEGDNKAEARRANRAVADAGEEEAPGANARENSEGAEPPAAGEPLPPQEETAEPVALVNAGDSPGDAEGRNTFQTVLRNLVPEFATYIAGKMVTILSQGLLVLLFAVFLLFGRTPNVVRSEVYGEIDRNIRSYLGVKVALSAATGIGVWIALRLLAEDGSDFERLALVFGILAFLLNFIPSIGSIIATLLPLPFALADVVSNAAVGPWNPDDLQPVWDNLGGGLFWVLLVLAIPGAVQTVIGNVLEPKLMGEGLQLHPITILLTLALWGLLWGPIGMLLATPMTSIIRIVLMRFEITRPVGRLLAGELPELGGATA